MTYRFFLVLMIAATLFGCKSNTSKKAPDKPKPINFHYRKLADKELSLYHDKVEKVCNTFLGKAFNGMILVAKNGQVVFEAYRGLYNFATKDSLTPNTPLHIASASKTFTGMVVLKLWEDHRLSLEDSVQKFFPNFPYHNITVQSLLSHRSGLPNYNYFMDTALDKKAFGTNEDMLNFMVTKQPVMYSLPNKHFHYCNTNFALLALIVEKVTQIPFPQYMQDSVFKPLGMNNTYVFSIKDTSHYIPSYQYNNAPYNIENIDCIYGDKNVYSTVRDMLQWDNALYQGHFVSVSTLQKAFEPNSNEKKSHHNYGLGWRIFDDGSNRIIYHNGWWHGNNVVFTRLVSDTATVIAIGNRYNRGIYQMRMLNQVFSGSDKNVDLEE